jgi:hypothetical protein
MVAAARAGQRFIAVPRVVVEEVVEQEVAVDNGEAVQAGTPFTVGDGQASVGPPTLFPEHAAVRSPFPKGGVGVAACDVNQGHVAALSQLVALMHHLEQAGSVPDGLAAGLSHQIESLGDGGAGSAVAAPTRIGRVRQNPYRARIRRGGQGEQALRPVPVAAT